MIMCIQHLAKFNWDRIVFVLKNSLSEAVLTSTQVNVLEEKYKEFQCIPVNHSFAIFYKWVSHWRVSMMITSITLIFQNPRPCTAQRARQTSGWVTRYSAFPVVLMAKVTLRQDGPDSLTSGQLLKLHTGLKGVRETTAVNTTAEITTTLMQENVTSMTYLFVVIA